MFIPSFNRGIPLDTIQSIMGTQLEVGFASLNTEALQPTDSLFTADTLSELTPSGGAEPSTAPPLIGPDTRVLHIGDSHTVGLYGQNMDKLLRKTGAKVATYGSAGSSPSWWMTGRTTRAGYYSKNEAGQVDRPKDWKTPRKTPHFNQLISKHKPEVIIISLGANLIHAPGDVIEREVHRIASLAKESGAKILWVGPPDGRESKKPTSKQDTLYKHLQNAVKEYGAFIDSRPLTEYPEKGGDGVHYWGSEGKKISEAWSAEVLEQIQATTFED